MKKTPIQLVRERFESKENLVSALEALTTEDLFLNRVNPVKGLARVTNAKLLHLFDTLTYVKQTFGTRTALIEAICALEKRTDEGFKVRLGRFSTPRLVDEHKASTRRAKRAAAEATGEAAPAKKKVARSKKAKAKAAAAAK